MLWDEEAVLQGTHVTSLAYAAAGELLVSYSEDNVFLLNPATGKAKQQYVVQCGFFYSLSLLSFFSSLLFGERH